MYDLLVHGSTNDCHSIVEGARFSYAGQSPMKKSTERIDDILATPRRVLHFVRQTARSLGCDDNRLPGGHAAPPSRDRFDWKRPSTLITHIRVRVGVDRGVAEDATGSRTLTWTTTGAVVKRSKAAATLPRDCLAPSGRGRSYYVRLPARAAIRRCWSRLWPGVRRWRAQ